MIQDCPVQPLCFIDRKTKIQGVLGNTQLTWVWQVSKAHWMLSLLPQRNSTGHGGRIVRFALQSVEHSKYMCLSLRKSEYSTTNSRPLPQHREQEKQTVWMASWRCRLEPKDNTESFLPSSGGTAHLFTWRPLWSDRKTEENGRAAETKEITNKTWADACLRLFDSYSPLKERQILFLSPGLTLQPSDYFMKQ